jgi:hypothetical protein
LRGEAKCCREVWGCLDFKKPVPFYPAKKLGFFHLGWEVGGGVGLISWTFAKTCQPDTREINVKTNALLRSHLMSKPREQIWKSTRDDLGDGENDLFANQCPQEKHSPFPSRSIVPEVPVSVADAPWYFSGVKSTMSFRPSPLRPLWQCQWSFPCPKPSERLQYTNCIQGALIFSRSSRGVPGEGERTCVTHRI